MTEVLRSPPQLLSSPSSPLSYSSIHASPVILNISPAACAEAVGEEKGKGERQREGEAASVREEVEQLSVLAFILTVLRKARCKTEGEEDAGGMEIGWPTDVRHVAHVTFDRFHGFLGLPVEFEPEVPRRAPSASAKVFGVSSDSMQCSYDCRGNSVPTILLLMQRSLYEQGGLKAEGIFRINAENTQEEFVRDQLNSGVVPSGIDVHCLAGLIKAWFRELPCGVLDPLSPEQVMQCQTEEDCRQLVRGLPPTEASLLNWAVNLMADVAQEEHKNKMNSRNVALVFAPNMTQMADPLTALMYAVQVMNFLKMLILMALKERQCTAAREDSKAPPSDPRDESGHQTLELESAVQYEVKTDQAYISEDPILEDYSQLPEDNSLDAALKELVAQTTVESSSSTEGLTNIRANSRRTRAVQSNIPNQKKAQKFSRQSSMILEKSKGGSILSRINSKSERVEAWR